MLDFLGNGVPYITEVSTKNYKAQIDDLSKIDIFLEKIEIIPSKNEDS